jgi:hypothetical protein
LVLLIGTRYAHADLVQTPSKYAGNPNNLTYFYSGLDQKHLAIERAEPIRRII